MREVDNKEEWREVLGQLKNFDFVHTYDFHHLSEKNGEGVPVLFVLSTDNDTRPLACWPALKRSIESTEFFDLTSVYGYGGPLFAKGINVEWALAGIWEAMRKAGVVSLFSRMHPLYIENIPIGESRGKNLGDVVVIEVQITPHYLASYRASHRREILNAMKRGIQVVIDHEYRELHEFSKIYLESMKELGASSYYFFDTEYFDSLISSKDFKTILIYAELHGVKVAASLFVLTGNVMQYYLSATVDAYRKLAPSKMIIARAHELAIELGVEKIVLGGGVGSSRDRLFDFKAGFSDLTKPFYITQKIFNHEAYVQLCKLRGVDPHKESFFPAYRAQPFC
ncbi:peptidoglycan bridge formation glycyltransferase FemA/FemB family protein [Fluviibacter phosphoraccumulans]